MKSRVRIDCLLVEQGLVDSRQKAQAMIMAGQVIVDNQKVIKAGQLFAPGVIPQLIGERPRYVSRGGLKLVAALQEFSIDVDGQVCLDVGASTGGFTDCLLQAGAKKVYAVDVGTNQLDWRLRINKRVVVLEKVNARHLDSTDIPELVDFVCCDVSFISVTLILPALGKLINSDSKLVILAKPQFEVGRESVGKGGIVDDPVLHRQVVAKIRIAMENAGFRFVSEVESPIRGAEGNREFLLYGYKEAS
ncbi:MAG: TlyA family rRNA (cytidine-2'-O)-methyltransferase [Solibacterales bacterium]|nr:TlyA family rRNA (cytidine-2'-O)-methyltransferase [Bryobacterales bacterium]|tara:strand:- start:347 stop:1090 length:744 start_codon:yes stop_codon:yes gene_type:complete